MKKVLFIGIPIVMVIAVGVYFLKFRESNEGENGGASTVEVQRGDIVEKALATGCVVVRIRVAKLALVGPAAPCRWEHPALDGEDLVQVLVPHRDDLGRATPL